MARKKTDAALDRFRIDWKNPGGDVIRILAMRAQALVNIREESGKDNSVIPGLFAYYRENPIDFIKDWGMTYDPRNLKIKGMSALVPFIPWKRQTEWLQWTLDHWRASEPGLTDKSRDCGASWMAISLSCTLCLFTEGMSIGFGSRKESYVDAAGDPKSLFEKGRMFLDNVPPEFKLGWNKETDAPHMRLRFPATESIISGEAGDNIGRGDRKSIYFIDEEAHLEHPELVEAALSATTDCRISMSSVNGMGNPFAIKRHSGSIDVFTFHWRDDPRKDDAWAAKKKREINNPTIWAQEYDIDYTASVSGLIIPAAWVQAAVDADRRLGIDVTGARRGALDVADEGADPNAFGTQRGIRVETMEQWFGKNSDIFATTERAFGLCDQFDLPGFRYDADGLGAGVRGDARVINERRKKKGTRQLDVDPYRGSGAVINPEKCDVEGRKNKDYFANAKAQGWWSLRKRFQNTYRVVVEKKTINHSELICIPSTLPFCTKLCGELVQPTYGQDKVGRMLINKIGAGTKSPNLADAVMMRFARVERAPMRISGSVLDAAKKMVRRR